MDPDKSLEASGYERLLMTHSRSMYWTSTLRDADAATGSG